MTRVTAPTTASSCLFSVMVEARERDGRVVFDFELTDILPSNSVKQIKEIIGDKIDIPPDQQTLIFGSKQLESGMLSDYNIAPDCTIARLLA